MDLQTFEEINTRSGASPWFHFRQPAFREKYAAALGAAPGLCASLVQLFAESDGNVDALRLHLESPTDGLLELLRLQQLFSIYLPGPTIDHPLGGKERRLLLAKYGTDDPSAIGRLAAQHGCSDLLELDLCLQFRRPIRSRSLVHGDDVDRLGRLSTGGSGGLRIIVARFKRGGGHRLAIECREGSHIAFDPNYGLACLPSGAEVDWFSSFWIAAGYARSTSAVEVFDLAPSGRAADVSRPVPHSLHGLASGERQ